MNNRKIRYCQYCGCLIEDCQCEQIDENEFFDRYYDDPYVRQGLIQQDIIDMYRRER